MKIRYRAAIKRSTIETMISLRPTAYKMLCILRSQQVPQYHQTQFSVVFSFTKLIEVLVERQLEWNCDISAGYVLALSLQSTSQ